MTEAIAVGGDFWVLEKPEVRVPGEFSAEVGKQPEARLDAGLVADPRVGAAMPVKSWPAKSVEARQPITLQGQLDTGESVTLLDARNHGGIGSPPRYVAGVAVLGAAQVGGTDQHYSAVRFRVDHPYWLAYLAGGDLSVVQDDGSTLSVEASEEGNCLVYASSASATLRQLEIRVVSGCLVLVRLAVDQDLVIRETQVRVRPGGPWLTVHGPAFRALTDGVDPKTPLLARAELTVERFAQWIALNDRLDGLAKAVANPVRGDLQTQVLVVTSLVEGLHRRLPYEQSKFPKARGKPWIGSSKQRGAAAAEQAKKNRTWTPEKIHTAVKNAVAHMEDIDYPHRATVVVTEVCDVVPEIAESVADLPGRLTKARNEMAHHYADEKNGPLEIRYRRWWWSPTSPSGCFGACCCCTLGSNRTSCAMGTWPINALPFSAPTPRDMSGTRLGAP